MRLTAWTGILVIFLCQSVLYGQVPIEPDATILIENGDRITGTLKLKNYPLIIKVYKPSGDSLLIPVKMIRKISLTPVRNPDRRIARQDDIRYFNQTFMGILSGRTNPASQYRSMIVAETVHGIKINTYLWPGIGIGLDQYINASILPVFLSISGDFLDHYFTPFYFINAGTGPAWATDNFSSQDIDAEGKLMYHIGAGIKMYSDHRTHVNISLGYKAQKLNTYQSVWGGGEELTKYTYKNLSIRIGVGF